MALVECVPNISEGRRRAVIDAVAAEAEKGGATLLDVDPGKATNRTVITFVGTPDQVVGVEAVALVDEAALELLLEVLERQRVELLDDRLGAEPGDAFLGGQVRCQCRTGRRVPRWPGPVPYPWFLGPDLSAVNARGASMAVE